MEFGRVSGRPFCCRAQTGNPKPETPKSEPRPLVLRISALGASDSERSDVGFRPSAFGFAELLCPRHGFKPMVDFDRNFAAMSHAPTNTPSPTAGLSRREFPGSNPPIHQSINPTPTAGVSRRQFLEDTAALAAFTAAGPVAGVASLHAAPPPAPSKTIGIQVGSVSFVDEGAGKCSTFSGRAPAPTRSF